MTINSFIDKVKDSLFEGYLWLSNEHTPSRVYKNAKIDTSVFYDKKSFIAEGLLYDKANKLSYQIRFIDGEYCISEYASEASGEEISTQKKYIAHRIDGVKKLKFEQIFSPKPDEECDDMYVLRLDRVVFKGFEY